MASLSGVRVLSLSEGVLEEESSPAGSVPADVTSGS